MAHRPAEPVEAFPFNGGKPYLKAGEISGFHFLGGIDDLAGIPPAYPKGERLGGVVGGSEALPNVSSKELESVCHDFIIQRFPSSLFRWRNVLRVFYGFQAVLAEIPLRSFLLADN